jgi:putative addiction module component (TIGR02574 family)
LSRQVRGVSRFLDAIDVALARHALPGETLELHLPGRSAMILGYELTLMTKDVDFDFGLAGVEAWPPEDRLRLIEEVWDGLSDVDREFELTEELKNLLDRRLAALGANPGDVVTWDEIKAFARRSR